MTSNEDPLAGTRRVISQQGDQHGQQVGFRILQAWLNVNSVPFLLLTQHMLYSFLLKCTVAVIVLLVDAVGLDHGKGRIKKRLHPRAQFHKNNAFKHLQKLFYETAWEFFQ